MKKVILSLAIIVILAIGAGVYYILTNLDAIVEAAIEKYGSQATQTKVRVDKVQIKLKEGSGAIFGLSVANPKGFEAPHAIGLAKSGLGIDYQSLKAQPYVIDQIEVRGPRIYMEVNNDKQVNLDQLRKNLAAVGGKGQARPASKEEADAPRLIIKRLTFTDGTIGARITPLDKDYDLNLPNINMTNLGGTSGATPTQLAKEILDRLITAAKKQIKEKGIDAEIDKLKAKGKAKLEEEKAKVEEKVDAEKARAKQEADTKLEEEKQKAKDKLQDLLSK
ncbi:MAG: hypothetical protein PVG75_09045 [Thioalkalispiraceae bacterium]|jgi:uncharacterized protein involved in outer membrane biogenesis